MKDNRMFPGGFRGWFLAGLALALAIGLTLGTVAVQRPSALFCGGQLGAGFPAAFVCDATGESPLSSVGKIDWADADSVNPAGTLVDIGFYGVLLWLAWLGVRRLAVWLDQRTGRR